MLTPDKQKVPINYRRWRSTEKYKIGCSGRLPKRIALDSADWSAIREASRILPYFQNHIADPDAVIGGCCLLTSSVSCVREPHFPRIVIERLPIASSSPRRTCKPAIDDAAAGDHGSSSYGVRSDPTIEFTWALILASARNIVTETTSVRSGAGSNGARSPGNTLGPGPRAIGSQVARSGVLSE